MMSMINSGRRGSQTGAQEFDADTDSVKNGVTPEGHIPLSFTSGRSREAVLEHAYQKALLENERGTKFFQKKISKLESHLKTVIIERNMMNTRVSKQNNEIAELNWKISRYEMSLFGNLRGTGIREQGYKLNRKRMWDFLAGPCSDLSNKKNTSESLTHIFKVPNSHNRSMSREGSDLGGSISHRRPSIKSNSKFKLTKDGRTEYSRADDLGESDSAIGVKGSAYSDNLMGIIESVVSIVKDMNNYRFYIKVATGIDANSKNENSMEFIESAVNTISISKDHDLCENSVCGSSANSEFLNDDRLFENMGSVARVPENLAHMNSNEGLILALDHYNQMNKMFWRLSEAFYCVVLNIKSVSNLLRVTLEEEKKLSESLMSYLPSKKLSDKDEHVADGISKFLNIVLQNLNLNSDLVDFIRHSSRPLETTKNHHFNEGGNTIDDFKNYSKEPQDKLENRADQIDKIKHKTRNMESDFRDTDTYINTIKKNYETSLMEKESQIKKLCDAIYENCYLDYKSQDLAGEICVEKAIEALSETISNKQVAISSLEENFKLNNISKDDLHNELKEIKQYNSLLEAEKLRLSNQLGELSSDFENYRQKVQADIFVRDEAYVEDLKKYLRGLSEDEDRSITKSIKKKLELGFNCASLKTRTDVINEFIDFTGTLKSEIKLKDVRIEALDSRLRKTMIDIYDKSKIFKETTEKFSKLEEENVELSALVESLRGEITKLELNLATSTQENLGLKENVNTLTEKIEELNLKCSEFEIKNTNLESEIKDLALKQEDSGKSIFASLEYGKLLEQKIEELETKIKQVESERNNCEKTIRNLVKNNIDLCSSNKILEESQANSAKTLEKLTNEILEKAKYIKELESNQSELAKNLESLIGINGEFEREKCSLENALDESNRKILELNADIKNDEEAFKTKVLDMQTLISEKCKYIEKIEDENRKILDKISHYKTSAANLFSDYKNSVGGLHLAILLIESFEGKNKVLNERLTRVHSFVKVLVPKFEELSLQLQTNNPKLAIGNVNEKIKQLTEALDANISLSNDSEKYVRNTQSALLDLTSKIALLDNLVYKLEDHVIDLNTQSKNFCINTQEKFNTIQEENQCIRSRLESNVCNLKSLEETLKVKEEEISVLKQNGKHEISDLETKVASLERDVDKVSSELNKNLHALKHSVQSEEILQAELQISNQENEKLSVRLGLVEEQLNEESNLRVELEARHKLRISELESEIERRTKEVNDLRKNSDEMQEEVKTLLNNIEGLSASNSEINIQSEHLRESLKEADAAIIYNREIISKKEELIKELTDQVSQFDDFRKRANETMSEIDKLRSLNTELRQKLTSMEETHNSMLISFKEAQELQEVEAKNRKEAQEESKAQIKKKVLDITESFLRLEAEVLSSRNKVKELTNENLELVSLVSINNKKMSELNESLALQDSDFKNRMYVVDLKLGEKEAENKNLKKEIDNLLNEVEMLRAGGTPAQVEDNKCLRQQLAECEYLRSRDILKLQDVIASKDQIISNLEEKHHACLRN